MADPRDDERWTVAIERYLEGRLFPSERTALRKRLAADPALLDRLVETVVQEAALRAVHARAGAVAPEADTAGIVRAAAARRLARSAPWVAAAVLGVAGTLVWLGRPPAPAAPARLRPADLFENDAHWRSQGAVRFKAGPAPGRGGGTLRVDVEGSAGPGGERIARVCSHAALEVQDWTPWDGVELGFEGARTGRRVTVGLHDTGGDAPDRRPGAPFDYAWTFVDDAEGWRTLRIPWSAFRPEAGRGAPRPFSHVFGIGFELRGFEPGQGCRFGEVRLYTEGP
jgi:hypothetical protein